MLNSKCNPKYFSNPKLPECSILDSMHNGKKFSIDLDKFIRGRIFFFFQKIHKNLWGNLSKIFLKCVVMIRECVRVVSLATWPAHHTRFSTTVFLLLSWAQQGIKWQHWSNIFWYSKYFYTPFPEWMVLAKIGPNIFGDHWVNLQYRT